MADLTSARAKLARARVHAETLKAELSGPWPNVPWAYHYPVTPEIQPNGLEYRFYVDPPAFDSRRYAGIVGDCLFNLRAALDHIVYSLHERRFRGRIPKDIAERAQFPILSHERRAKKSGKIITSDKWNEICSLSIKQRKAIQTLQPYNRRNDKFSRTREFLSELATLNNIDKHRYLHVVRTHGVAAPVPGWNLLPGDPYGFRHESFFVPLEGKTEVFRWTFDTAPPDIAQEMKMNDYVTACVALNEGGEQLTLLPHVDAWIDAVEAVLRRFETFVR